MGISSSWMVRSQDQSLGMSFPAQGTTGRSIVLVTCFVNIKLRLICAEDAARRTAADCKGSTTDGVDVVMPVVSRLSASIPRSSCKSPASGSQMYNNFCRLRLSLPFPLGHFGSRGACCTPVGQERPPSSLAGTWLCCSSGRGVGSCLRRLRTMIS